MTVAFKRPQVEFVISAAAAPQFPRDGRPEVAFLGRSNVGKSSLLNALAGVKGLAKVSSTPGRTRLVNFFRVDGAFYLADLPGYGYAKVPEAMRAGWEALVNSYLSERPSLALSVFLVDARHDPTEGDETLRSYLDHYRRPYVMAVTKIDKLGHSQAKVRRESLARGIGRNALAVIAVSALTREGLEELWRTIRGAVDAHPGRGRDEH